MFLKSNIYFLCTATLYFDHVQRTPRKHGRCERPDRSGHRLRAFRLIELVRGWHNAGFKQDAAAMTQEDRFISLEIKLAQQEDLLDELNKTIYRQERRIDQLEAMVAKLADHVRTLRDAGQAPLNERPPHY